MQVTWVEHVEIEDKTPVHRLYRNLIYNGLAFGAQRWLTVLQRMCERLACLMVTGNSTRDLGGGKCTPIATISLNVLIYLALIELYKVIFGIFSDSLS